MKQQKILAILIVFMGMLLGSSIADAAQISSSHSIVSAIPSTLGGDVTLNITFTNTGASNLYAIEATEQSLLGGSNPTATRLIVGDLPAGQSTTLSWIIHTSSNIDQIHPGSMIDLLLNVTANDAGGNAIADDINSSGVM